MNYYELLDIARGADANEIKRAYFKAVKIHSPDLDPEGFKAVRLAFETLTDEKKRAEYDAFFTAPDTFQNDLLAARELMRQNQFNQAAVFLSGLDAAHPGSAEIRRLLAEVLWTQKKNGTADKICKELLEKDPKDHETLVLRARIAASRGHTTKAKEYFEEAVAAAPLNEKAWSTYIHFATREARWLVHELFERAMELNEDMFRDEYIVYWVVFVESFIIVSEMGTSKSIAKFTEFFSNDKDPDDDVYTIVVGALPPLLEMDDFIPYAEQLLPTLERYKCRDAEYEESLLIVRRQLVEKKLHADERIHDVLADLTCILMDSDMSVDRKLDAECYIVYELPGIRSSIKALRDHYPEYFKLNQEFYLDALNDKKTDFMIEKYYAIQKRLLRKFKSSGDYDSDDDDDFEEVRSTPFVREAPKVGRNDPCPCGSGKKYKKCCGA